MVKYIFVSGRVKEILGYEPSKILGKTPFDFMPALYTGKKSGGKQSMEEMKALMSSMANNKE